MHISLPRPLKNWSKRQVSSKGYSTTSEYLRYVLRREQEQEARTAMDALLNRRFEQCRLDADDARRLGWTIRREGLKRARKAAKAMSLRVIRTAR